MPEGPPVSSSQIWNISCYETIYNMNIIITESSLDGFEQSFAKGFSPLAITFAAYHIVCVFMINFLYLHLTAAVLSYTEYLDLTVY